MSYLDSADQLSSGTQSGPGYPTGVRRFSRMIVDISVRVFAPAPTPPTNGRGHDVSGGGMALYVPIELNIGDKLQLSFQLPYSRMRLGISAFVRNRNGFRYGVEFVGLTAAETAEIQRVTSILELANRTR